MDIEKQLQQEEILTGLVNTDKRTYSFNKTYEFFGKKLQGTFVAKYMSISDRMRIGVIRAKLLDGAPSQSMDTLADDIAYIIAYLQVSLIEAPKWWNYEYMTMEDDYEKLKEVYMEVFEFNKHFRGYYASHANVGYSANESGKKIMENM